jgi:hypothetical protein
MPPSGGFNQPLRYDISAQAVGVVLRSTPPQTSTRMRANWRDRQARRGEFLVGFGHEARRAQRGEQNKNSPKMISPSQATQAAKLNVSAGVSGRNTGSRPEFAVHAVPSHAPPIFRLSALQTRP